MSISMTESGSSLAPMNNGLHGIKLDSDGDSKYELWAPNFMFKTIMKPGLECRLNLGIGMELIFNINLRYKSLSICAFYLIKRRVVIFEGKICVFYSFFLFFVK